MTAIIWIGAIVLAVVVMGYFWLRKEQSHDNASKRADDKSMLGLSDHSSGGGDDA